MTALVKAYVYMEQGPGIPETKPEDCKYAVTDYGGWGYRQCSRKKKHTISGYEFCSQHAEMLALFASEEPR